MFNKNITVDYIEKKITTIIVDIGKTYKQTNRNLNYTIQNVDSASINRMCKFFSPSDRMRSEEKVCFHIKGYSLLPKYIKSE